MKLLPSVHEGELRRIVELEAGDARSGGGNRRLRQLAIAWRAFSADLRQGCGGRRPECAFDRGQGDLE